MKFKAKWTMKWKNWRHDNLLFQTTKLKLRRGSDWCGLVSSSSRAFVRRIIYKVLMIKFMHSFNELVSHWKNWCKRVLIYQRTSLRFLLSIIQLMWSIILSLTSCKWKAWCRWPSKSTRRHARAEVLATISWQYGWTPWCWNSTKSSPKSNSTPSNRRRSQETWKASSHLR